MEDVIGALGGFRGVRAELLVALKKAQPRSAHELGEQFGLTANALRRHLKALEDDGLVCWRRNVRGVGAPVYAYSLTAAGEALFPRSYAPVLATALESLRASGGDAAVTAVLDRDWELLAIEAEPVLASLLPAERLPLVAELLTAKGYMAEAIVDQCDDAPADSSCACGTLRVFNCAMRDIVDRFPEACAAEARFVERMLGVPVVRRAHRREGCGRCEYAVLGHHSTGLQEQA